MLEIIRWVTIGILWVVIAGNVLLFVRLFLECKRTKEILRRAKEINVCLEDLVHKMAKLTNSDE